MLRSCISLVGVFDKSVGPPPEPLDSRLRGNDDALVAVSVSGIPTRMVQLLMLRAIKRVALMFASPRHLLHHITSSAWRPLASPSPHAPTARRTTWRIGGGRRGRCLRRSRGIRRLRGGRGGRGWGRRRRGRRALALCRGSRRRSTRRWMLVFGECPEVEDRAQRAARGLGMALCACQQLILNVDCGLHEPILPIP